MKFTKQLAQQRENERLRRTHNYEGAEAFGATPELELVTILLTSMLQDQFYRTANKTVERLRELIREVRDKQFVAKAAIYARTKAGMRSVSHLTAGELAHLVKGEDWSRRFYDKVVHRVDDVLEILAYTLAVYGKPIPNSLKKGLGEALARFDGYQLAKYKRESAALKLVDAVNLLHPPHTEALRALVSGTLAPAQTWETRLTQAGQVAESEDDKADLKAAAWSELIRNRKIGYFALLRNLRNIMEQAGDLVPEALKLLVDEKLIRRSLVMPFRFQTALKTIRGMDNRWTSRVLSALSDAVDISLRNVPRFEGRTLVALDTSASMMGRPIEIGALFAAVLYKSNDADLLGFSSDAQFIQLIRRDSTLTLADQLVKRAQYGGTNFHAIFERASRSYDRVIILSDMQGWMGYFAPTEAFAKYVRRVGKRPRIYSFDLAGYGTLQFPEQKVYCLAGFSDKTMETLRFLEEDKSALLREIEVIEL